MNVERLVKRAKKGDKEALLQLILAEKDSYYRLALTYMGNADDALDALEETIAEMTNVSIGTVKSRIFNGLKRLRDYYRGADDE